MKRKLVRVLLFIVIMAFAAESFYLTGLVPLSVSPLDRFIQGVAMVALIVVFSAPLFMLLIQNITKRAQNICEGLEQIQKGDYVSDIRLERPSPLFGGEDEMDRIAFGINAMQLEVAKREQKLLFKQESMEGILKILTKQSDEIKLNYEMYRIISEETNDGMMVIDFGNPDMFTAGKTRRILGYDPDDFEDTLSNWMDRVHPEDRYAMETGIQELRSSSESVLEMEIRFCDKLESYHWFAIRAKAIVSDKRVPVKVVGSSTYIETWKKAQESIYRLAYFNQLTDLPNRYGFLEFLNNKINVGYETGKSFAVILVNLDRFKRVNDILGHELGDYLIRRVSERLRESLPESDFLGHLSGDEFVVLSENTSASGIETKMRELLNIFNPNWDIDERSFHITASLGISVFPEDGREREDLLKKADMALDTAKEAGGNCGRLYQPGMNVKLMERMEIESALRNAVLNEEFQVYYQPKVAANGKIEGFEALLRWIRAYGEVVPPSVFIPSTEETGLIIEISDIVLRDVCKMIRDLRAAGYPELIISINLSPVQFDDGRLVEKIRMALQQYQVSPTQLEVEITETLAMENFNYVNEVLGHLRRMGIRIALDDFGKGYSSLNYLRKLDIDTLKVDRDFIRDIGGDISDTVILDHIISIAHNLKLKVVAEGVETYGQFRYLVDRGCNEYQGYLFSRPIPAEKVLDLMNRGIEISD